MNFNYGFGPSLNVYKCKDFRLDTSQPSYQAFSATPPPHTHTHTHTPLMSMPTEAKGGRLGDWNASKLAELVLVDLLPLNSLLWK